MENVKKYTPEDREKEEAEKEGKVVEQTLPEHLIEDEKVVYKYEAKRYDKYKESVFKGLKKKYDHLNRYKPQTKPKKRSAFQKEPRMNLFDLHEMENWYEAQKPPKKEYIEKVKEPVLKLVNTNDVIIFFNAEEEMRKRYSLLALI